MKNSERCRASLLLLVITLVAPLLAFTLRGGDSFEIYLGNTLALQQFLHRDKTIKTVDLSAHASEELNVSFSHCGQTGKDRTLAIKDSQQILKEWKFADARSGGSVQMNIPVKEIMSIRKNLKGKQLSLFYKSDLMKEGKVLAMITAGNTAASLK